MQESLVPKQKQYRLVLVDTWWYWVSMKRYWLIYDGTGSVEGGTGWYLVALGQNRAVMVANVICLQKIYGINDRDLENEQWGKVDQF